MNKKFAFALIFIFLSLYNVKFTITFQCYTIYVICILIKKIVNKNKITTTPDKNICPCKVVMMKE